MRMAQPQTYQEKLEEQIVNMLIDALEKKEITEETMSVISGYVLDHVTTVIDNKSAILFLEALVEDSRREGRIGPYPTSVEC